MHILLKADNFWQFFLILSRTVLCRVLWFFALHSVSKTLRKKGKKNNINIFNQAEKWNKKMELFCEQWCFHTHSKVRFITKPPQKKKLYWTNDMWHMTYDMLQMTQDMWHITWNTWWGSTFSQNFSSLTVMV